MLTRDPTASPPHHPQPRYRPGGEITRDLVLATELEIIDRDGAEALSMRRLAAALVRDLMIIYQHARTRWSCSTASPRPSWPSSRSTPPTPTGPPSCAPSPATTARLALARPHVVPLLVTRPLATALGLRPCGRSKTSSGSPGPASADPTSCTSTGPVRLPAWPRPERAAGLVGNPDETDGLHRLPITEFLLLRGLAPVLSAYDGAAELERGLDILLTGLATAVTPREW